jgi:hypothetical protein
LSGQILKKNPMPYHPFDTGWIKSLYPILCLGWFLFTNGLLPLFTVYSFYNNICIPFSKMIMKTFETIGNISLSFGNTIISIESTVFHTFNYVDPIYNAIKQIEQFIPNFEGGRPPSFKNHASNVCLHKTSSGRHLASYFARKRRFKTRHVITPQAQYYYNHNFNNERIGTNKNLRYIPTPNWTFHPSNDQSYHDHSWYDVISPYWTGGMVWGGAYVL